MPSIPPSSRLIGLGLAAALAAGSAMAAEADAYVRASKSSNAGRVEVAYHLAQGSARPAATVASWTPPGVGRYNPGRLPMSFSVRYAVEADGKLGALIGIDAPHPMLGRAANAGYVRLNVAGSAPLQVRAEDGEALQRAVRLLAPVIDRSATVAVAYLDERERMICSGTYDLRNRPGRDTLAKQAWEAMQEKLAAGQPKRAPVASGRVT